MAGVKWKIRNPPSNFDDFHFVYFRSKTEHINFCADEKERDCRADPEGRNGHQKQGPQLGSTKVGIAVDGRVGIGPNVFRKVEPNLAKYIHRNGADPDQHEDDVAAESGEQSAHWPTPSTRATREDVEEASHEKNTP